jgi:hyperosmotically inducible periplasmic protein
MQNMKNIIAIGGVSAALAMASLTGCSNIMSDDKPHDERSEGRVEDDKHITKQVKSKLKAEPVYRFDAVDVNTWGGIVQLSGFVNDPEQKQRAEDIARGVGGVSQVVNGLVIKPAAPPTATGRPSGQQLSPPPGSTNTTTSPNE